MKDDVEILVGVFWLAAAVLMVAVMIFLCLLGSAATWIFGRWCAKLFGWL